MTALPDMRQATCKRLSRTISTAFLKLLQQIRMEQAQPAVALCREPAFLALLALDLVRKIG